MVLVRHPWPRLCEYCHKRTGLVTDHELRVLAALLAEPSKGQKDSANAGSSSLGRADSASQHAAAAAANGATGIDLGAAPSQLPSCLSHQQYSVQPQSPYPPVSPGATSPYPSSPLPPQLQPAPPHQQPPPVLQGDSRRSVLSAAADPAAAAAAADDGGLLVAPTETLGAAGQAAGAVAMAAAGAAAGATAGGSSKSAVADASGSISNNGVTRMPVAEGNEHLPYPDTTAVATATAVERSSHGFESFLSATSAATSAAAPAMGPAADAVAAVSTAPPAALQSGHSITRRDARKPHSGNQQQALLPPPVSPARSGQLEPAPSSPQVLNVHAHRQASAALALQQAHVLKTVVEGSEGTHSSGARTPTSTPAGNVAGGVNGGGGGGGGSGRWALKTWDNKDVHEEAKQCYRDNVVCAGWMAWRAHPLCAACVQLVCNCVQLVCDLLLLHQHGRCCLRSVQCAMGWASPPLCSIQPCLHPELHTGPPPAPETARPCSRRATSPPSPASSRCSSRTCRCVRGAVGWTARGSRVGVQQH